ncbi:MAG: transporter [Candidatus Nealsonbacteria bacterium]|nr:transporter [Candidatus Nealsonbacteria bacterium]
MRRTEVYAALIIAALANPVWGQNIFVIRGQDAAGSGGGGSGDLAAAANNPTSDLTIFQIQNTFVPNTYEASGFSHTLGLQMVKPFKTGWELFPTWVTRSTLPVITTADPDGSIPIGPPNDGGFSIPLDNQSGLGDFTFISILNHPTDWGSVGVGPGFMAPTATRPELGEQSWKFSPTFVVMYTAIENWQFGLVGYYNFPFDDKGSKSLMFQPIIVRQLGNGWFTGWGDDLWSFNTDSGNFAMPLQLRLGKVHTFGGQPMNIFVTGAYTPDDFHKGPAPEWSIKLSVSYLFPG